MKSIASSMFTGSAGTPWGSHEMAKSGVHRDSIYISKVESVKSDWKHFCQLQHEDAT